MNTSASVVIADAEELRRRARQALERAAVTPGYRADRDTIIRLLNEGLATEIVCVLRYRRHHVMATGILAQAVAEEFLEHANEEQRHADMLAQRISQLGGQPNFDPRELPSRSYSRYNQGKDLLDMIREDLVAERVTIDIYADMIRSIGNDDPTTRRMLEQILATEEQHAGVLEKFLDELAGLTPHAIGE